jgi:hypothetical protein
MCIGADGKRGFECGDCGFVVEGVGEEFAKGTVLK